MPALFQSSGQTPLDAQAIQQKRQLAQLLMMKGLQPQQVDANTSPLAAVLAPFASALAAKRLQSQADQGQQALEATRKADMANVMAAYEGKPAQTTMVAMNDDNGNPMPDGGPMREQVTPAVPGGRDAMLRAMLAAKSPDIQAAGFKMMAEKPNQAEWALGEIGAPGDMRQSVFFNKFDPSKTMPVGQPIKKSGQQIDVSVSTEKKYGEQFAGQIAKNDADLRETAFKAPNLAERANQIKAILASGNAATGMGADYKLAFGKAAAAAGLKGAEDYAANTEVLASSLAQNTLDAIKASGLGSGTGFSNADRDFLEKAVGGKLTLEPASIDRLANLAHRAADQSANRWNKRVREIPSDAIQGTGISREPVSVAPLFGTKPAASGNPAIDELLKKY